MDEVFKHLDLHVLFKLHWGGRGVKGEAWDKLLDEDFRPRLKRMWKEKDEYIHAKALLGYFPCNSDGNELVIFDPEDPERSLSCSERVLAEAFECLGNDIVLAHAKDLRVSGVIVAAGRGDLDYDLYLEHLLGAGYRGPLILHGLGEEEVEGSVTFLRRKLVGTGFGTVGTVGEAGR